MGARVLVLGVLVALIVAATSSAGTTTTGTGRAVFVYVNITDTGIRIVFLGPDIISGQQNLFPVSKIFRGQWAAFQVHNLGKKPHNFAVLGKKTPTILPGRSARFFVSFLRRGAFPYASTVDAGKAAFRGVLTIY
jgi:hypothetical protein